MMRPIVLVGILALAVVPLSAQPCGQAGGPSFVTNQTIVGAHWTRGGSPWRVNNSINVLSLLIDPGVVVEIAPGARITVPGSLTAQGTESCPIVFRSQFGAPSPPQRWDTLVLSGAGAKVLRYCRIEHARNSGIQILNATPTVEKCSIRDNTATTAAGTGSGGGVLVDVQSPGTTVSITDCEIVGNSSELDGGGVSGAVSNGAVLVLTGCSIVDNRANPTGNPTAQTAGGGIRATGNTTIDNCVVRGNEVRSAGAQLLGAGIAYTGTGSNQLNIRRSVVSGNSCIGSYWICCGGGASGGGIAANGGGTGQILVVGTMVVCNTVNHPNNNVQGGGVAVTNATALMTNCTVANNSSHGLHTSGGVSTLDSCIIWHNDGGAQQLSGNPVVRYSNVQMQGVVSYSGVGNINAVPQFVGPVNLAGIACTEYAYALFPFSPCIDAGNPASAMDDACRGPAMPAAFSGGPRNDMGAHGGPSNCEFTSPAHTICGVNRYGTVLGGLNTLVLAWLPDAGTPTTSGRISIVGATSGGPGMLAVSAARAFSVVPNGPTLLVPLGASTLVFPFSYDASGAWTAPADLSNLAALGAHFTMQAAGTLGADLVLSNGLEIAFCY